MASLNKVMLIGNLTRDPEIRYTPKGSAVCDLALAVNRRYTLENGEKQEEVTYLDIVLWNKQAELAEKFLNKGRAIFVEGRLQMDTWEDKATGQKRSKIKIVGENIQFLDSKGAGSHRGGDEGGYDDGGSSGPPPPQKNNFQRPAARPQQRPQQQAADEFGEGPITDGLEGDDIPF
jgi:single-strand DNA-binding protein